MENLPSFGGEKPKPSSMIEQITTAEDQNLAEKISGATTTQELVEIIAEAGGIARSDRKIISSEKLASIIADLVELKNAGAQKDGMPVILSLNRITRSAGLRQKVEDLIFGK